MKLAFLGLFKSFDYFQVGGTESFIRRLTFELLQKGIDVDYIFYGDKKNKEINISRINLIYFKTFRDALIFINKKKYTHIITIYLLPEDRIKYALFKMRNNNIIKFHFIYFSWPDSWLKRLFYFTEARLFPYNGKLFCISKRQYEYVKRWANNVVYLLPPVPDNYFLKLEEKPINEKIRITFLGRVDPGKGIDEVIEIFKTLKGNDKFDCSIYGIHIPEHKESFKIHNFLKNQDEIKYIEVERKKYSPEVEEMVRNVLKNTDILILPYKKLSSTIDTPLTLLEAMASLCVVITKPFGNIPDIYGKSKFIIPSENFVNNTLNLLNSITYKDLIEERKRIYERNNILNFKASSVAKKFIEALDT
ncbi:MAG: glycosyltransferase family 4 protein [Candidatus Aenigmatarchaeota archaeon]